MAMTAGPEKTDSPYHESWILNQIDLIQTALIGPAQQWYSHLPLEKKWRAFWREFQKIIDNQQSQTKALLLLESITRAFGKQIKTTALRIEQMTLKTYANNTPDMRDAQMNEALAKHSTHN